jgi:hypothetical protein
MSVLSQHRAAIVATLGGVVDIGHVHDRERYARDEAGFRAAYLFTGSSGVPGLRGWWLRRTETKESSADTGEPMNEHTWHIRGYMAFNDADASELVFDELVEAFRDAVRQDLTLGGACDLGPLSETEGVQVLDAGPVMFAGVLCHSVVLQLKTWSYP